MYKFVETFFEKKISFIKKKSFPKFVVEKIAKVIE